MGISIKNQEIIQRVLGIIMMGHGAYTVCFFSRFLATLNTTLISAGLDQYYALGIGLSLFPFIAFFLGALLILGLYTRKTLWCSIFFFGCVVLFLVSAHAYTSVIASGILLVLLIFLLIFRKRIRRPRLPRDIFYM